jgi:hypothetical protein
LRISRTDPQVIEEVNDGVFRSVEHKVIAKVLFGALDEMATNWVLSHKRYSLVSTAEPVLDVFLNGIAQTHSTRSPGRHRAG